MATGIFRALDRLFTSHICESTFVGRWGSHEVRSINLIGGVQLHAAIDEERAYWYEVVFTDNDGGRIRIEAGEALSPGNLEIVEAVLRENGA